jgi:rSAM/selenodomain-associated transferase 1
MGNGKPTCIVMVRAPYLRQVKTRLEQGVGAKEALRIYRRLVEHQVNEIPNDWQTVIQFTPSDAEAEMRKWLGEDLIYRRQIDEELGARLIAAMQTGFTEGLGPCFVIGSDCPGLCRTVLERAVGLLDKADVVIGPAADGGYTLLGLNEPDPALFRGITWGISSVLEQTLSRVAEAGLSVSKLPGLEDVDDVGSWERNRHLLD